MVVLNPFPCVCQYSWTWALKINMTICKVEGKKMRGVAISKVLDIQAWRPEFKPKNPG